MAPCLHCHQRQRSTDIHKPNLCLVAYGRYAHKQGKDERQCAEAEFYLPQEQFFLILFHLIFSFYSPKPFLFTCQSAFNLFYVFCCRKVLWNYTTLHKHISNSSIVGNMLLAYTTFSLKVFGLYIHARHFCRKIFCFDTDSGEEICQWSFLGDSHASLQRCSIQTK